LVLRLTRNVHLLEAGGRLSAMYVTDEQVDARAKLGLRQEVTDIDRQEEVPADDAVDALGLGSRDLGVGEGRASQDSRQHFNQHRDAVALVAAGPLEVAPRG